MNWSQMHARIQMVAEWMMREALELFEHWVDGAAFTMDDMNSGRAFGSAIVVQQNTKHRP